MLWKFNWLWCGGSVLDYNNVMSITSCDIFFYGHFLLSAIALSANNIYTFIDLLGAQMFHHIIVLTSACINSIYFYHVTTSYDYSLHAVITVILLHSYPVLQSIFRNPGAMCTCDWLLIAYQVPYVPCTQLYTIIVRMAPS